MRKGFTLLEVLIAVALFGIAAAGLLMAVNPTYGALAQLSDATSDAGDLELVKGVVEATTTRDAVLAGGTFTLPSDESVAWTVELAPTDTEAMYLVHLRASRGERVPLDYEYLHFEPNWRDQSTEQPRWLQHSFGSGGGGGGGGAAQGQGQQGRGQNGQKGQGQTGQGQTGRGGQGQGQQGRGQGGQGQGQGRGQGGQGQGQGARGGQGGQTGGGQGGQTGGGSRSGR